jgi:hypothetical protein
MSADVTGAAIAQSVEQLATGWTVRGSNPGGARISARVQTGLLYRGERIFPGGKAAGAWL